MKKWTPKVEFTQVEGKVICSDDKKKKKKIISWWCGMFIKFTMKFIINVKYEYTIFLYSENI